MLTRKMNQFLCVIIQITILINRFVTLTASNATIVPGFPKHYGNLTLHGFTTTETFRKYFRRRAILANRFPSVIQVFLYKRNLATQPDSRKMR